jgi:hypothetical protein
MSYSIDVQSNFNYSHKFEIWNCAGHAKACDMWLHNSLIILGLTCTIIMHLCLMSKTIYMMNKDMVFCDATKKLVVYNIFLHFWL